MIFHCYVSSPEGIISICAKCLKTAIINSVFKQIHMISVFFIWILSLMCSNLAILLDTHCFRVPIQCQLIGGMPLFKTPMIPWHLSMPRGALRFWVWWPEGQDARRQRVIRRRSCRGRGLGWDWVVHSVVQNLLRTWDIAWYRQKNGMLGHEQKWWTNWPVDFGVPELFRLLNSWTLRELEIAVSFGFEWEDSIQCSKDNRLVSQELRLSRFHLFNDHHLPAIPILTINHVP